MLKKLKKFLNNKYVSLIANAGYMIGWIFAYDYGVLLWYFLITTSVLLLLFWKELYSVMKLGGEVYADWCKMQSYKITKKVYKDYVNEEMEGKLKAKEEVRKEDLDESIGNNRIITENKEMDDSKAD